MVGIDVPHAAIAINVVAREQNLPQSKRQLGRGVAGGVPDIQSQRAELELVPFVDGLVEPNLGEVDQIPCAVISA